MIDIELVKALLILAKYCASCDDCANCQISNFCGKLPLEY